MSRQFIGREPIGKERKRILNVSPAIRPAGRPALADPADEGTPAVCHLFSMRFPAPPHYQDSGAPCGWFTLGPFARPVPRRVPQPIDLRRCRLLGRGTTCSPRLPCATALWPACSHHVTAYAPLAGRQLGGWSCQSARWEIAQTCPPVCIRPDQPFALHLTTDCVGFDQLASWP